jgi:hypothetical protein
MTSFFPSGLHAQRLIKRFDVSSSVAYATVSSPSRAAHHEYPLPSFRVKIALLTIRELTGASVETRIDTELPKIQNLRVDLLGETAEGSLIHLELQSSNDSAMALRMAEYSLGIYRLFGRFPHQVLLYVGEPTLRMESELRGSDVFFRYEAIDVRALDGERLLESSAVGDNVIAVLARLRDHGDAVRKIVERIAGLPAPDREAALGQLLVLAGLSNPATWCSILSSN